MACYEDITEATGDIYEEIRPVLPVRRATKLSTKYDTLPPLNKLKTYSKDDFSSPNQETEESKDRHKRGFSEMITKKMNKMKHKVIRHISDQGSNHDNGENVTGIRQKQLYRSKSTDDLLCIDSPNVAPASFVPVEVSRTGVPLTHSIDDNAFIGSDKVHIYDYPRPTRPARPALPERNTKGNSQNYVNTVLARATVSPMRGGKTDTVPTRESNIYETVTGADSVRNKQLIVEEAYSKVDLGNNDALNILKSSPESELRVTKSPKCRKAHQTVKSDHDKLEDLNLDMYVDMDIAKAPMIDKVDHKLEDSAAKVFKEVQSPAAIDIRRMTINDIGEKLKELRLETYVQSFKENQVDGMILSSLKADDFVQELGHHRSSQPLDSSSNKDRIRPTYDLDTKNHQSAVRLS